ncbi:hypothetical protein NXS98_15330 [Fontisphaera persica]|uniref:hypothetical protein n=1 Tax=Fontisphaera persica TaxID=2974023 RepID=UPI0024BF3B56|nr:hypothetical protein [Fontisphaera persica]WCJ59070.1 hypothetical protein NXS98_15330 [Fontisphaera persica]
MQQYEILTLADKPALLGISTLEWQVQVMGVLDQMGYKVHAALDHEDFMNRFTQYQYQVTILEETFHCATLEENQSLAFLQKLPMHLRRHATVVLLSETLQTLNPLQAFALSVHGIINRADFSNLEGILAKIISDNELFLVPYRQTHERIIQGKV